MTLQLYNTLTRRKEEFVPQRPGEARLYTCGPTVHDYAHIGNFRTFTFYDLLRRTLRSLGFRVHHLLNLTDVEDRIIRKSHAAGVSIQDYTAPYVEAFHRHRRALRIEDVEGYPRATEHIPDMVALIQALERKGHTYTSDGSVYYRVASFPAYGRLARIDAAGQRSTSRVDADEYDKLEAQDFVLWKAARPGEPTWPSPYGPGRPGWHIECSAMALRYLGETLDIHAGATDLVFPHHENEIAQSEAATGAPFSRYWLHAEFLNVEGDKMSKRLGNFATLEDLVAAGHTARALRYAFLGTHYRKPMNYTEETARQAEGALARLDNTLLRLGTEARPGAPTQAIGVALERSSRLHLEALADDLNAPEALAALHGLLTDCNTALDRGELTTGDAAQARSVLDRLDSVLAILPEGAEQEPPELFELIEQREQARAGRNWAEADRLRARALELGFVLEDVKAGGTRWKRA